VKYFKKGKFRAQNHPISNLKIQKFLERGFIHRDEVTFYSWKAHSHIFEENSRLKPHKEKIRPWLIYA